MIEFIVLSEAPDGHVHASLLGPDAAAAADTVVFPREELARAVARLEREHHPRWVWDDTARWYPGLLAAGVRIERCHDLRLVHTILRASELTATTSLARSALSHWDQAAARLAEPDPDAGSTLAASPPQTALFDDTLFAVVDDPPGRSTTGQAGAAHTTNAERTAAGRGRSAAAAPTTNTERTAEHGRGAGGGDAAPASAVGASNGPTVADRSAPAEEPDELVEFRAQRTAVAEATDPSRIALLTAAESAGALVAAEMRHAGLPYSAERHDELLEELLGPRPQRPPGARPGDPDPRPAKLEALLAQIREALGDPTANPDSPAELLKSLRRAGIRVDSTRSWDLTRIDHPAIPPLLDYKKRARILTANGWNWSDTWVRDGRFHPTYIPGGVVTGRWASEGGGALQLPKAVRSAVRADPGHLLVVADAAQLEPRILAALAGDRAMAEAGRGRDLYDGIVASGAVDTRPHAKLGMLGAMYGGTTGESGRMLPRLARAYPAAIAFVEAAARTGEAGNRVSTRLGRTSPRPSDDWLDLRDAAAADGASEAVRSRARQSSRSWGRFTRNFVVQGTAAEWALCWISSIRRRLWALGDGPTDARLEQRPHLAFFLHDEVMVHTPAALAEQVAGQLREAAAEAGRLIFGQAPVEFPVTVAIVDRYDQAK
ncbi:bifunctional 3'-5' exonuclease/DNA polymerase [Herbiconiux sp.]|uniref:bifunctional 3'-5' exonuclease/DNA polymerase n=1 Tax=Herbiconiux sp. TaxID=1871186 RepID=UPI0025BEF12B|nr:bifunctional 3'-5' exonuclease/DNA polymerase [Herbiconiux sp.]